MCFQLRNSSQLLVHNKQHLDKTDNSRQAVLATKQAARPTRQAGRPSKQIGTSSTIDGQYHLLKVGLRTTLQLFS